ncbi:unnamed protein product [Symbiodinium pilosum]|uniref:Uncharacterized protein n=1 Tax=Symbiodinium pilosum TaxID=2952 RepID=A0A812T326_SYMPI|nr:unnamed protein product [Symbiodinium pilosum]
MSFASELPGGQAQHEEPLPFGESRPPPPKTLRALGTRPVGLRLSLPNGSGSDTLQARQPEQKSGLPLDSLPGPSLPALPVDGSSGLPNGGSVGHISQSRALSPKHEHPPATAMWKDGPAHGSHVTMPSMSYYGFPDVERKPSAINTLCIQPWKALPEVETAAMEVG